MFEGLSGMGGLPMEAILSLFAANNPQAGPTLDQMGVPLPMGLQQDAGGLGGMINPTADKSLLNPGVPNPQTAKLAQLGLAGMQGAVAPKPITPVTHAGVTGGVPAPKTEAAGLKQGAPAIQAMIQALMQKQQQATVPSLGQMIRGAT